MKKLLSVLVLFTFSLGLIGCEIIQEEIDRVQSLKLEEYKVDIANRNILLKITSNDEEEDDVLIRRVIINEESYDLVAQENNWYLLENIPIAKSYDIGNVYYVSGVGVTVPFDVDFSITIEEALTHLPDDDYTTITEAIVIDGYTFSLSEESLIEIESIEDYIITEIDDWVWLVLEGETPKFAVIEINNEIIVISAPENTTDYIQ